MKLLAAAKELLDQENYCIENVDATIIAQRPKMAPHIPKMRENVAKALGVDVSQVNIKATTEEGLGFTGTGEGISAQAVCLITGVSNYQYIDPMREVSHSACEGCQGCPRVERE